MLALTMKVMSLALALASDIVSLTPSLNRSIKYAAHNNNFGVPQLCRHGTGQGSLEPSLSLNDPQHFRNYVQLWTV